jgi:hypothetical protein
MATNHWRHEKTRALGFNGLGEQGSCAFQMAEVAIPKNLFADILRLIAELRAPPDAAPA